MRQHLCCVAVALSVSIAGLMLASGALAEGTTEKATAKTAKLVIQEFHGTITAIDAKAGTVSIKSDARSAEEKSFIVAGDAKFRVAEGKAGKLEDFVKGRKVFVDFSKEEGGLMIHQMGFAKLKAKLPDVGD